MTLYSVRIFDNTILSISAVHRMLLLSMKIFVCLRIFNISVEYSIYPRNIHYLFRISNILAEYSISSQIQYIAWKFHISVTFIISVEYSISLTIIQYLCRTCNISAEYSIPLCRCLRWIFNISAYYSVSLPNFNISSE
jgi:hypothetical protein